ncbi:MAG: VOC family protein [Candidatus Dormiibacterota bacterium]
MRTTDDVCHIAIPTRDLDEAFEFYVTKLGCKLARRYDDRITLDFFGDQLVCHLNDYWDREVRDLYPRHFGVTFRHREDFDRLMHLAETRGIDFYNEVSSRFEGLVEEHLTVVFKDPSNNLIEFKWYHDPRMAY